MHQRFAPRPSTRVCCLLFLGSGGERWMQRREFIALLCTTACAMPFPAHGEGPEKIYRVGYIIQDGPDFWESDLSNPRSRAFNFGLRDLGYVEGHNLVLRRRSAEGKGL